jgi:hypothetical protein
MAISLHRRLSNLEDDFGRHQSGDGWKEFREFVKPLMLDPIAVPLLNRLAELSMLERMGVEFDDDQLVLNECLNARHQQLMDRNNAEADR